MKEIKLRYGGLVIEVSEPAVLATKDVRDGVPVISEDLLWAALAILLVTLLIVIGSWGGGKP